MQKTQNSLIESVAAANITDVISEEGASSPEEGSYSAHTNYDLSNLVAKANADDAALNIEITPYENRIIIPKI